MNNRSIARRLQGVSPEPYTSKQAAVERELQERRKELERSNRRIKETAELVLTLALVGAGTVVYAVVWVVLWALGMV